MTTLSADNSYDRLKVLYGAGKLLSYFDSVETVFPEILSLCATTFPFVTGVLIERRGKTVSTAVWNTGHASPDQIDRAIQNAKEAFIYLTGATASDSHDLRSENTRSTLLEGVFNQDKFKKVNDRNYVALPLVVDHLPAFGILQLEGSVPLDEKDLEFVEALADLIAISVDRYHKTKENSAKLFRSQAQVLDLEAERELREKFVSLLSHDLRTPLSAAKLNVQLILRQKEPLDTVRTFARRIETNLDRADQMISDLLDANRIRGGEKLPLKVERFDLSTLVRTTLDELAAIHGNRFIFKDAEPLEGYWDPKGLRRILENLCNNAIKYGHPGSPVTLSVMRVNGNASIQVQNMGEVISTEEQKFLFQQFRRGRKVQSGKKKGWGIGLTLVRGVAEAHGGNVKLESTPKRGTVFTVILPIDSRPFIPNTDSPITGLMTGLQLPRKTPPSESMA